jgi:redox-sensitive bicupin YhaK (pirin superfamily)
MKIVLHKANERGRLNFGWLDANYSFSFGEYYNPAKIHFGALRVLNDDFIEGGAGFPTHPHNNMEIVTIPLEGALEHKDSTGGHGVIKKYDVQIMSAGSGVYHSEFNHNKTETANILQTWVFPNEKNVKPRYAQKTFLPEERINKLQTLVSPDNKDGLWLHQNAWYSLGNLSKNFTTQYVLHSDKNGVYVFLISVEINVNGTDIQKRDATGIYETNEINITAKTDSEVLLIEIPMQF